MAWTRLHRPFRGKSSPRLRALRRRAQIFRSECQDRRSKILSVRRGAQGRHQALAVQSFWQCVHSRNATRRADGLIGGRLRGLLSVRRREATSGDCGERCGMNVMPQIYVRPRGKVHVPTVTLAHGGGGKAMKDLIDDVFVEAFDNPLLALLDDQARLDLAALARHGDRLAFTTDSFVVDPLVFPGGDIGKLAVCGTVNDLAVGGARPLYLSCAAIVEEGVTIDLLRQIAGSMAGAAADAGVEIVTGD